MKRRTKDTAGADCSERKRKQNNDCVIHCTDESGDLATLKDYESWQTLLNAAVIRKHERVLSIAESLKEGELPKISYHRKCRSIFTLKRDLQKLSQSEINIEEQGDTSSRRSSVRQPATSQSRVYERICVFCNKTKYLKGTKTREALIQCVDMRADERIRRAALSKSDSKILAIVARELVAAEACYHKSCYCDYTRNVKYLSTVMKRKKKMIIVMMIIPQQRLKHMTCCSTI